MKKAEEVKGIKEICQAIQTGKKISMSDSQARTVARYQMIVDLLKKYRQQRPDLEAYELRAEIKKEVAKQTGVSLFQAGIDYVKTLEYFEVGTSINQRELNIEAALQENADLIERAVDAGDLKSAAQFERNKVMLLKLQSDKPIIDWHSIPFPVIRFAFNPKILGGSYKKSLQELYAEINEVESTLNIDSRNYKDSRLIEMFDISDVEFEDITTPEDD